MLLKFFPFTLLSVLFLAACSGTEPENRFFRVADGYFIPAEGWSENSPYYYIGANFWYGAILGSETAFGDRERLSAELDSLKSLGIDNLRILVGGDGPAGIPSQIEPSLQTEAGVYDESVFRGLDWLLAEMGKRKMSAVLYLNNAWEWSGGYARYLEWAGAGKAVLPSVDGWPAYMEYASRFVTDDRAKELFADHIRTVVSRTNTVTGIPYREDPAIFSWQIANEPRCFSEDDSVKTAFAEWIAESAALVKSIDPNHMVSAGSEGSWGCENDISLYEKIHSCPDIDYLTVHVWPYNWSWTGRNTVSEDLQSAIEKTDEYIDAHLAVAGRCSKPVVIEEFGYPRDGFRFEKGTPTFARDTIYPDSADGFSCGDIVIADAADDNVRELLREGRKVLLFPAHEDIAANSLGGLFTPDYWNWSMFRRVSERAGKEISPGTLSVINDPGHPAFSLFPNEGHSSWQWWSISHASRPLIMDNIKGYTPVLQVIDNIERCHKLGIVAEFAVGNGSLLICTTDIGKVSGTPEGKAFVNSLLHYAASPEFKPSYRLEWDDLLLLLYGEAETGEITGGVENPTDYSDYPGAE